MAPKRLGKGLDALLGTPGGAAEIVELGLGELAPGPHQPRKESVQDDIAQLAASIKETGVLQPVVVRKGKSAGRYEIVMGERRWRAAKLAGLKTVPAIVRDVADSDALVMALVENLQRKDINPVEKARAFRVLIDTLSLTQTQAAGRLGLSRVSVSNTLRLLELPVEVKEMLSSGKLSAGHARALLMVKNPARCRSLARRIVAEGLSVRQVEGIAGGRRKKPASRGAGKPAKAPQIVALEQELSELLGSRVSIQRGAKGGKVVVDFYTAADFDQIVEVLRRGAS